MGDNRDTTTCPADLDRASKTVWRKTRHLLIRQDRWRPEYSLLLERYVRACEVARLARARIAERARTDPTSAYTSRGSQGQLVPHPDLKTAREAERDATDYARELTLTPASRAKVGDHGAAKVAGGKFAGAFG
jgi:P27 family predicted phage terminase small subunit